MSFELVIERPVFQPDEYYSPIPLKSGRYLHIHQSPFKNPLGDNILAVFATDAALRGSWKEMDEHSFMKKLNQITPAFLPRQVRAAIIWLCNNKYIIRASDKKFREVWIPTPAFSHLLKDCQFTIRKYSCYKESSSPMSFIKACVIGGMAMLRAYPLPKHNKA